MKNVLLLGAVAILVILGMRSCDANKTPQDAAKSATSDTEKKDLDAKKAEKAEAATDAKPAKKEATADKVARKKVMAKKRVRKAPSKASTSAAEEVATPAVNTFPSSDHHKSNRYVFGGDNTK